MTHKLIAHNFSACYTQNVTKSCSNAFILIFTFCLQRHVIPFEFHLPWFWLNAMKRLYCVLKSGRIELWFILTIYPSTNSSFHCCILSVIATHAANFHKLSIEHLAKLDICSRQGTASLFVAVYLKELFENPNRATENSFWLIPRKNYAINVKWVRRINEKMEQYCGNSNLKKKNSYNK